MDDYTLKNINLTINKGDKVAIVGLNGAGKSTLVKLILSFYKPQKGEILINGEKIDGYSLTSYWSHCSAIFQKHNEFSISIGENVAFDKFDMDNCDHIWSSLECTELYEKISSYPNGLNSELSRLFSSEGIELSGGERQKLALARMLYKDSDIMVMDEPSSALDLTYETKFNALIESLPPHKTAIIITHRLSSVFAANRIVFLKDGVILSDGSHKYVYENCPEYKKMFDEQLAIYKPIEEKML